MAKAPHPVEAFEADIIANAEFYTAFLQVRPGQRINQRLDSLFAAEHFARGLADSYRRPVMIYAVNPQSRQALVRTVQPDEETEMNTTTTMAPVATHKTKADAIKAARAHMGAEAIEGLDFSVQNTGAGWAFAEVPDAIIKGDLAPKAADSDLIVDGVVYPNKTRANDARRRAADEVKKSANEVAKANSRERHAKIGAALEKTAKAKAAPKAKAPREPKAPKAPKVKAEPKARGGKAGEALAAAQGGTLPEPPDFSAETHKRFRPKLEKLVELIKAADVKGLRAEVINPISSSPKALDRYRNLAVVALEAQAAARKGSEGEAV